MSRTTGGMSPSVDQPQAYDVGIIGAGIVGLMVCYRLSSLGLRLAVFERNPGPGQGVTSGQASVIQVVQFPFGTMKSKLARLGNKRYDQICSDLGVPLVRVPAILVVRGLWTGLVMLAVYPYLKWSLGRDFRVELARGRTLHKLEPELSESAVAGVVVHGYGVIDWQKLVERLTEELRGRGVDFFFGTTVNGATATGEFVDVQTTAGHHPCRYAVNAAGLDSDEMAKKLGSDLGSHTPGLGVMAEFSGPTVRTIISLDLMSLLRPSKHTKGGAIIPTTKGTVVFGPTLRELPTKEAPSIGEEDLKILTDKFGLMLKNKGELVRLFSGVRPISPTGDFIVEYSKNARTVNLIGIESPGLTASPAIADLVLRKLEDAGLGAGGGR